MRQYRLAAHENLDELCAYAAVDVVDEHCRDFQSAVFCNISCDVVTPVDGHERAVLACAATREPLAKGLPPAFGESEKRPALPANAP